MKKNLFVAFAWLVFFSLGVVNCISKDIERVFDKGLDLLYEGRYEDAESHFLTLARTLAEMKGEDAYSWRAKALYQAGRIEHLYLKQPRRAVSRLREALKLDPEGSFAFDARKEIAFIFYDRFQDYRAAALEFELLTQAFPSKKGMEEFMFRIAQCYFMLHQFDQARTEAKILLEKYPEGPLAEETMLLVANAYYLEGKLQEAADAHLALLKKTTNPEIEARSRFELGMCYQELEKFQEAEDNYVAALRLHPRPDLVQLKLSSLMIQRAQEGAETKQPLEHAAQTMKGVDESAGLVKKIEPQRTKLQPQTLKEKIENATKPKGQNTNGEKQSIQQPTPKKVKKTEPAKEPEVKPTTGSPDEKQPEVQKPLETKPVEVKSSEEKIEEKPKDEASPVTPSSEPETPTQTP